MKPTSEMTFNEMAAEIDALRGNAEQPPKGKRAVYVVDRGWIFAGDASETEDGMVRLDRAVWLFRWESIGFAAAIKDWKSDKVDVRRVDPVEIPKASIVFRIPCEDQWGLK